MPRRRQILLIEDDVGLRATLAEQLAEDGQFGVDDVGCASEAEAILLPSASRYDAILLDVGLPDADGRDLCAKLRERGVRMPVIMLAGATEEQDVVRGLDSGANDYIPKPVRFPELLARLRTQLRLSDASEDTTFAIGPYTFRPAAKMLLEGTSQRKIRLTNRETTILRELYAADGRTLSRAQLMQVLWGDGNPYDNHALETHIYRLRRKIEPGPGRPTLLQTAAGGYRLEVTALPPRDQLSAAA